MKLSVLALDFDGTIAGPDGVDPGVRAAIAEFRAQGVLVVIVTGRVLDELRTICGGLHFVDAVVAENGAMVEFPDSRYREALAPARSQPLVEALRADGVPVTYGHTVIETAAADAPRVLSRIRAMELPLSLLFNRGRLMVLPQAVSKATGLKQALTVLRLSTHNTLGIGDAENDHELLRTCEIGVAVEWGSAALKQMADYVAPGTGPADLAAYLRGLDPGQLPPPTSRRHRLQLGHTTDGRALSLRVRGRNVLIAGDPKSGKSWAAGLLCEQLVLQGYSLCVIDPEGDYTSLESLPGVNVFGGVDPLPRPRDLLRALRHPDGSVVVDLSHTRHHDKLEYIRALLPGLAALRRRTGLPHRVVLDEAHYVLNDEAGAALLDLDLNGYTLVTYRASELNQAVLRSAGAIIVTRESDPREVEALAALCADCDGDPAALTSAFRRMVVGEALVLPVTEEAGGAMQRIRLMPRLTPHARHAAKYVDIPVTPSRAFRFESAGGGPARAAGTLREFVETLEHAPREVVLAHARRGDFSKWIADVLGDFPLAATLRAIEADAREGRTEDAGARVAESVRGRYEFVEFEAAGLADG